MNIGPEKGWLLRLFGAHVDQAFGHVPYHVGSSLTAKKGERWRDVDVRLILPDDEFAAYFTNPLERGHEVRRLMMWNMAWSALGRKMTGLPVDFQFQQQTAANEEFDGPRGALVILDYELPTVETRR